MSLHTIYYVFLVFAAVNFRLVCCVFFYSKITVNESDSYKIYVDYLDVPKSDRYKRPPNVGKELKSYRNIAHQYTPDERCEKGLPLSMAVIQYPPYVHTTFGSKFIPGRKVIINGTTHHLPFQMKAWFTFFGLFPEILKNAIPTCCNASSDIRFAKMQLEQYLDANIHPDDDFDFTFPLYGESMEATTYLSNPFIPIIQAPSVALLLLSDDENDGKTHFIATTTLKAWPMILFMVLIAGSSGIIMWCLDRNKNEDQFPKPFINGTWDGFWWAFITMTTVGYGDRTPKSFLARFFCILWIIFSIVIVSVYSGLITSAFSASTKIHFNLHGAKIGAVERSEEFKFGLSLNADMQEFPSVVRAFGSLSFYKNMSGILLDSYIANSIGHHLVVNKMRVDRMMDHPITYGIRMAHGAERLEKCLRKYLRDHPQEVFDMFRKTLNPVKNPKDRENLQEKEAKKLFNQDKTMENMLIYGGGLAGCVFIYGFCYLLITCIIPKINDRLLKKNPSKITNNVVNGDHWGRGSFHEVNSPLKELLDQYNCFQEDWLKKMKTVHQD